MLYISVIAFDAAILFIATTPAAVDAAREDPGMGIGPAAAPPAIMAPPPTSVGPMLAAVSLMSFGEKSSHLSSVSPGQSK